MCLIIVVQMEMRRIKRASCKKEMPEGTFVEGKHVFRDGQGRKPAGCSFPPGARHSPLHITS